MSWPVIVLAIGLVLVLEGILPFLSPPAWRRTMQHMAERSDRSVRIIGLVSLLLGAILVYLVHSGILLS